MSDPSRQTEDQNKSIIRQAFEDWASGAGGVFGLLADDATWTIVGNSPVSRTFNSRQEFMDGVINPFNARMATPLRPTVHKLYAEDDTVIAYFDAAGTAKDGKPYANTYTWYLRMKAGRIVETTAFFDTVEFNDFWSRISA